MPSSQPLIEIYDSYRPGVLGRIADLHGAFYHPAYGFDHSFEGEVATELAEFLANFEVGRDGLWLATLDGVVEGSIALDGRGAGTDSGARLRWFLLSDSLRGRGVGMQLVDHCMQFCRDCGYSKVELFTFDQLTQARRLYERAGFELVKQWPEQIWGTTIQEQRFVFEEKKRG